MTIDRESEDAPPADDRRQDEFPTDVLADPQPTIGKRFRTLRGGRTTVEALENMWAARDEQYASDEKPLSERAIRAIREWRLLEVRDLLPSEQVKSGLATKALTWVPPR